MGNLLGKLLSAFRPIPVERPRPQPRPTPPLPGVLPPHPDTDVSPDGFLGWLNATRAGYGLGPVARDPEMLLWAARNTAQQVARRQCGHFLMGQGPSRRENAAWSPMGFGPVPGDWFASPGHRDALLDPGITRVGLAGDGGYWTFCGAQ